jgi:8-oxo-dGTP pyrophosphatase MutT (NUDIX family)
MTWVDVRERVAERTKRVLADLHAEWGTAESLPDFEFGPKPWHPDEPPGSVEDLLAVFGGIAAAVVFYTPNREETVLGYNRGGYWEPPGGAIEPGQTPEETAVMEAREETGLDVEVVELLSTRTVHLQFADGSDAPLPVATFVAHRTDGTLRVERETNDHPGVTRGVGLFGPDVLPENCRDRERVLDLFDDA